MIQQNNLSFWVKSLQESDSPLLSQKSESILKEGAQFDIVIIGGGLTGLWLAYYLNRENPELSIAIFEKEQVGYGASGRNGGWLSREVPIVESRLKKKGVTERELALFYNAMTEAVAEVIDICEEEQIDCDLHQGGVLTIATNTAQVSRISEGPFREGESLLTKEESARLVNIPHVIQSHYDSVGARIQPFKLLMGLKHILIERGIWIYENREVISFSAQSITVAGDAVNAPLSLFATHIICCTESYSESLLQDHKVIPMNSSIIVTEVISEERWAKIGWENRALLADDAHLFFYAQRTADNRILIGGRGSPYQYGGKDAGDGLLDDAVQQQLLTRLHELFPWEEFKVEYAWKGSIGVTRDWCASVSFDEKTKNGKIYGFVGSGVTTTNLAARTMRDRILAKSSKLTRLPWNNHDSPKWEREPLRYLAIHGMYGLLRYSDYLERQKKLKKTSFVAQFAYKICGLA